MREHPRRPTYAATGALAALLLVSLMACGGGDSGGLGPGEPAGYAAEVMQETDTTAGTLLPAVVADLGVQVFVGQARFVECELTGWRYQAEGDLVGDPDPAAAVQTLTELMQAQDLEVENREDGSLVGRRGELSLLVGAPTGPTQAGTVLRHYTFTHACTPYAEDDVEFAGSAPRTDYAAFVTREALYTP